LNPIGFDIQKGVLPGQHLQCQQRHLAALNRESCRLKEQLRQARLNGEHTQPLIDQLKKVNEERNLEKKRQRNVAYMQRFIWLKL